MRLSKAPSPLLCHEADFRNLTTEQASAGEAGPRTGGVRPAAQETPPPRYAPASVPPTKTAPPTRKSDAAGLIKGPAQPYGGKALDNAAAQPRQTLVATTPIKPTPAAGAPAPAPAVAGGGGGGGGSAPKSGAPAAAEASADAESEALPIWRQKRTHIALVVLVVLVVAVVAWRKFRK